MENATLTVHEQSNTQQAARTLDSKRAAAVDVCARSYGMSVIRASEPT